MNTRMVLGGFSIHVNVDHIEVTSMGPRPDPEWSHVDASGHVHRWSNSWSTGSDSFVWVQDEDDWMDEEGEEYPGEGHYECRQCHEHLSPGLRGASPCREYIPGQMTITACFSDGSEAVITQQELNGVSDMVRARDFVAAERSLREAVDNR